MEKEKNLIISCEKQEEVSSVFENIKACFDFHKAAGGVVRFDGKVLVINKYNRYDLPKGHVEQGETDTETA
ncbi:MAG: hypothetical protein J5606_03345, partial [Bacteroidales bacterium]|nr:hypothetical protein [Bacteroidales bacterium]